MNFFKKLSHALEFAAAVIEGDDLMDKIDQNRPAPGEPLVIAPEDVPTFYKTMEPAFKISRKIE